MTFLEETEVACWWLVWLITLEAGNICDPSASYKGEIQNIMRHIHSMYVQLQPA